MKTKKNKNKTYDKKPTVRWVFFSWLKKVGFHSCRIFRKNNCEKRSILFSQKNYCWRALSSLFLSLLLGNQVCFASHAKNSNHVHHQIWALAVQDVVDYYGPSVDRHTQRLFRRAGLNFPPKELALIAIKEERKIELWAREKKHWAYIKTYPLKGYSGGLGPKLRQGDGQIPEGLYHISIINPFSHFHLSLKLNYPNEFDRSEARHDHRSHLGGDIFIHGKDSSVGCLPIGDKAIEELFVLVNEVGRKHVKVIIAPFDMRHDQHRHHYATHPRWLNELYANIDKALEPFKAHA